MKYNLRSSTDEDIAITDADISIVANKLSALQDGEFICLVRDDTAQDFMQVLCTASTKASIQNKIFMLDYTESTTGTTSTLYTIRDGVSEKEAATYFNQFLNNQTDYTRLPRDIIDLNEDEPTYKSRILSAITSVIGAILIAILIVVLKNLFQ